MKRLFIITILFCLSALTLNAQTKTAVSQKNAYINIQTILESLPEYNEATKTLDALSEEYKKKIDDEYAKIETLYNNYQRQKNSLSATQRTQRENTIINKEREVKKLQESYFGEEGIVQKKSEELLNPIRKKVQDAIDKVAKKGNYLFIFDIATIQGVVYKNPLADLSNEVIKELKK